MNLWVDIVIMQIKSIQDETVKISIWIYLSIFWVAGLQIWNEEDEDWEDWYIETENDYYDDVDEYCDSDECEMKDELKEFSEALYYQIDYSKL